MAQQLREDPKRICTRIKKLTATPRDLMPSSGSPGTCTYVACTHKFLKKNSTFGKMAQQIEAVCTSLATRVHSSGIHINTEGEN